MSIKTRTILFSRMYCSEAQMGRIVDGEGELDLHNLQPHFSYSVIPLFLTIVTFLLPTPSLHIYYYTLASPSPRTHSKLWFWECIYCLPDVGVHYRQTLGC